MGCGFGQGYFYSPPVDAEAAFRQIRSTTRVSMSETGSESEGQKTAPELEDDSPTVMLPAGMILESRIHDDADTPPETSGAT